MALTDCKYYRMTKWTKHLISGVQNSCPHSHYNNMSLGVMPTSQLGGPIFIQQWVTDAQGSKNEIRPRNHTKSFRHRTKKWCNEIGGWIRLHQVNSHASAPIIADSFEPSLHQELMLGIHKGSYPSLLLKGMVLGHSKNVCWRCALNYLFSGG